MKFRDQYRLLWVFVLALSTFSMGVQASPEEPVRFGFFQKIWDSFVQSISPAKSNHVTILSKVDPPGEISHIQNIDQIAHALLKTYRPQEVLWVIDIDHTLLTRKGTQIGNSDWVTWQLEMLAGKQPKQGLVASTRPKLIQKFLEFSRIYPQVLVEGEPTRLAFQNLQKQEFAVLQVTNNFNELRSTMEQDLQRHGLIIKDKESHPVVSWSPHRITQELKTSGISTVRNISYGHGLLMTDKQDKALMLLEFLRRSAKEGAYKAIVLLDDSRSNRASFEKVFGGKPNLALTTLLYTQDRHPMSKFDQERKNQAMVEWDSYRQEYAISELEQLRTPAPDLHQSQLKHHLSLTMQKRKERYNQTLTATLTELRLDRSTLTPEEIHFLREYPKYQILYYPNQSGNYSWLHYACAHGMHPNIIKMLVQDGFSLNEKDGLGQTSFALWIASYHQMKKNHPERVEAFLNVLKDFREQKKVLFNRSMFLGESPMEYIQKKVPEVEERVKLIQSLGWSDPKQSQLLMELIHQSNFTHQNLDLARVLELVESGANVFATYYSANGKKTNVSILTEIIGTAVHQYTNLSKSTKPNDQLAQIILMAFKANPSTMYSIQRLRELQLVRKFSLGFQRKTFSKNDDGFQIKHSFSIGSEIFYNYVIRYPDLILSDKILVDALIYHARQMSPSQMDATIEAILRIKDPNERNHVLHHYSNRTEKLMNTYNRTIVNQAVYVGASNAKFRALHNAGADFDTQKSNFIAHHDATDELVVKQVNNNHIDVMISNALNYPDKENLRVNLRYFINELGYYSYKKLLPAYVQRFTTTLREVGFEIEEIKQLAETMYRRQFAQDEKRLAKTGAMITSIDKFFKQPHLSRKFKDEHERAFDLTSAREALRENAPKSNQTDIEKFILENRTDPNKNETWKQIHQMLQIPTDEDVSVLLKNPKYKKFYQEGLYTHENGELGSQRKENLTKAFFENNLSDFSSELEGKVEEYKDLFRKAIREDLIYGKHFENLAQDIVAKQQNTNWLSRVFFNPWRAKIEKDRQQRADRTIALWRLGFWQLKYISWLSESTNPRDLINHFSYEIYHQEAGLPLKSEFLRTLYVAGMSEEQFFHEPYRLEKIFSAWHVASDFIRMEGWNQIYPDQRIHSIETYQMYSQEAGINTFEVFSWACRQLGISVEDVFRGTEDVKKIASYARVLFALDKIETWNKENSTEPIRTLSDVTRHASKLNVQSNILAESIYRTDFLELSDLFPDERIRVPRSSFTFFEDIRSILRVAQNWLAKDLFESETKKFVDEIMRSKIKQPLWDELIRVALNISDRELQSALLKSTDSHVFQLLENLNHVHRQNNNGSGTRPSLEKVKDLKELKRWIKENFSSEIMRYNFTKGNPKAFDELFSKLISKEVKMLGDPPLPTRNPQAEYQNLVQEIGKILAEQRVLVKAVAGLDGRQIFQDLALPYERPLMLVPQKTEKAWMLDDFSKTGAKIQVLTYSEFASGILSKRAEILDIHQHADFVILYHFNEVKRGLELETAKHFGSHVMVFLNSSNNERNYDHFSNDEIVKITDELVQKTGLTISLQVHEVSKDLSPRSIDSKAKIPSVPLYSSEDKPSQAQVEFEKTALKAESQISEHEMMSKIPLSEGLIPDDKNYSLQLKERISKVRTIHPNYANYDTPEKLRKWFETHQSTHPGNKKLFFGDLKDADSWRAKVGMDAPSLEWVHDIFHLYGLKAKYILFHVGTLLNRNNARYNTVEKLLGWKQYHNRNYPNDPIHSMSDWKEKSMIRGGPDEKWAEIVCRLAGVKIDEALQLQENEYRIPVGSKNYFSKTNPKFNTVEKILAFKEAYNQAHPDAPIKNMFSWDKYALPADGPNSWWVISVFRAEKVDVRIMFDRLTGSGTLGSMGSVEAWASGWKMFGELAQEGQRAVMGSSLGRSGVQVGKETMYVASAKLMSDLVVRMFTQKGDFDVGAHLSHLGQEYINMGLFSVGGGGVRALVDQRAMRLAQMSAVDRIYQDRFSKMLLNPAQRNMIKMQLGFFVGSLMIGIKDAVGHPGISAGQVLSNVALGQVEFMSIQMGLQKASAGLASLLEESVALSKIKQARAMARGLRMLSVGEGVAGWLLFVANLAISEGVIMPMAQSFAQKSQIVQYRKQLDQAVQEVQAYLSMQDVPGIIQRNTAGHYLSLLGNAIKANEDMNYYALNNLYMEMSQKQSELEVGQDLKSVVGDLEEYQHKTGQNTGEFILRGRQAMQGYMNQPNDPSVEKAVQSLEKMVMCINQQKISQRSIERNDCGDFASIEKGLDLPVEQESVLGKMNPFYQAGKFMGTHTSKANWQRRLARVYSKLGKLTVDANQIQKLMVRDMLMQEVFTHLQDSVHNRIQPVEEFLTGLYTAQHRTGLRVNGIAVEAIMGQKEDETRSMDDVYLKYAYAWKCKQVRTVQEWMQTNYLPADQVKINLAMYKLASTRSSADKQAPMTKQINTVSTLGVVPGSDAPSWIAGEDQKHFPYIRLYRLQTQYGIRMDHAPLAQAVGTQQLTATTLDRYSSYITCAQ